MAAVGRLRVLLGAAPGVGKTFAMLKEGQQLLDDGRDVVIGVVETHGRKATAHMIGTIPIIPRLRRLYRGITLDDMDVDAIVRRAPEVVLVDELAHTNAPGSRHAKRWEDVDELLRAGIDVISTLNIQHIESLNDVVERITRIPQRETVPDTFLRRADDIEVIDLSPQALRNRLSNGLVYPAERVDAALSNYFRLGNLTALRELALLWLAGNVDEALSKYRTDNDIDTTWEARERVVVALPGGPEGETLLRRGARIAARSGGGELLAVHVTSQDGLRSSHSHTDALAKQRRLVERLGGTYHQVVGADIPTALVEFARSVNATQLVLGASRRGRMIAVLTGTDVGASVIRKSGDIDVHMVTHAAAGRPFTLPHIRAGLSRVRRIVGFVLAVVGVPALTAALGAFSSDETLTAAALLYQLLVVVIALVGGIWPALFTAVLSAFALDYFFLAPTGAITIQSLLHIWALLIYMIVAALVSFVVDRSARFTRAAQRVGAESELLQTIAGSVLRGDDAIQAMIDRTLEAFSLKNVQVKKGQFVIANAGLPTGDPPVDSFSLVGGAHLDVYGEELEASDRRLLRVVATQIDVVLERRRMTDRERAFQPIAASDKLRGALLSALSHDLRRPLAAATAAVGGLRMAGPNLSASDRGELLETAEQSLDSLGKLIGDLLDMSRLRADALTAASRPTDPAEVVAESLEELDLMPGDIRLSFDHGDALAAADPGLLQRAVVNLLANARRHSPSGTPVALTTSTFSHRLEIRIIDHGPGVDRRHYEDMFVPFQRLGDTDNGTGLGLGLALSKGFVEAMHGTLVPEPTPGGGLTMVISLPLAKADSAGNMAEPAGVSGPAGGGPAGAGGPADAGGPTGRAGSPGGGISDPPATATKAAQHS